MSKKNYDNHNRWRNKTVAFRVSAEEYFENVGNVQYHLDEPLANPSANLLYFLSERASEDLKVSSEEAAIIFFASACHLSSVLPYLK